MQRETINTLLGVSLSRRQFLASASALAVGSPDTASATVVSRVVDGATLDSSGPIATWVLPPGSCVKPFVIEALLDSGRLKREDTFLCPGNLRIAERNFACSHPRGLPPMNAARAIAYSCNTAVVHFAQRFSSGELSEALRRAGFRVVPVRDPELQALGEEGISVTPLEMVRAYRKLAQHCDPAVLEGLEGAVQYGTAQRASLPGIMVAGKTGSAMTSAGLHAAWFAGFAPSNSPQIVAVVAMQGHSGGADAAPVAADLLHKCLPSGPVYSVHVGSSILTLRVEEYVAAVLAGESSVFQHPEALKAMAVAARTFAAHERGRHSREGFDFCNTTHCQRAEPNGVNQRLTAAAIGTAGEMIWFEGKPAFTPYTMSCGGMAEAAEAVWPDEHAPCLRVHPDPFCPPSVWTRHVELRNVARALRVAGLECPPNLRRVGVLNRTASGRARQLQLEGEGSAVVSAGAFRFAVGRTLGWNTIRSDFFELRGALEVQGKGEGHGVGLCQQGAEGMAARGHTYREILAFYYPGTSTTDWVRLGGEAVVVYATDAARDHTVLASAEQIIHELPWRIDGEVSIYVYPNLDAFRSETREPGWVAAHTQGHRIDLQPVAVLEAKGVLEATLRHELLHVAVETRAHPGLPVWFREGLVEWLADGRTTRMASATDDTDLRQRTDEARAAAAYRDAAARVNALVHQYGDSAVLSWVSRGLPAEVKKSSINRPNTNSK